jgi:hypothetical protein
MFGCIGVGAVEVLTNEVAGSFSSSLHSGNNHYLVRDMQSRRFGDWSRRLLSKMILVDGGASILNWKISVVSAMLSHEHQNLKNVVGM